MELRRLQHFLAVVDNGGFSAAADEVPVSQPGLSQSVKQLEHELGVGLFERIGRRVQLTPAGVALVGPARQVLRDVETGRAAVAAVAGVGGGSLALASLPTLAADPLAGLVGHFRRLHPGVVVDLAAPEDTTDLVAMVRDGRCEVGVTEAAGLPDDLVARSIGQQALVLVVPPGFEVPDATRPSEAGPRGGGRTLALSELVDVAFVAAPVGTSTDQGFAAVGAVPKVAVVTAQRDAILPLVLAGAGAALVPGPSATAAEALGAQVIQPDPAIVRGVAVVHRAVPLAPAAARFLDLATSDDPRP
jgi:LysR family transcriptional regulator, carnitine catabolism transcriptional activator